MTDYRAREGGMDWRTLNNTQPPDGQPVEVIVRMTFDWRTATWHFERETGLRQAVGFAALPSDTWRPEDDR